MAIICSKYLDMKAFSYNKATHTLVAEASDIAGANGHHDGRVYDDACDVGFIMNSPHTGRSVLFVNDGVDYDSEQDVCGWRYKAAYERHRSEVGKWVRTTLDMHVLIIND